MSYDRRRFEESVRGERQCRGDGDGDGDVDVGVTQSMGVAREMSEEHIVVSN